MADTTELVPELLEAGVHFGHQTKRWNPKMKPFIFEQRNQIYIINLDETVLQLRRATEFLQDIARMVGYASHLSSLNYRGRDRLTRPTHLAAPRSRPRS